MFKRLITKVANLPMVKPVLFALTWGAAWAVTAPQALAANSVGSTTTSTGNATDAFSQVVGKTVTQASIITDIKNAAMGLFGIVTAAAAGYGIIYIALGGIGLIHGGGQRKQEAMEKIRNGAIGIVVALASGTIVALAGWLAGMFAA